MLGHISKKSTYSRENNFSMLPRYTGKFKVKKILEGSLDLILPPSPFVKIQIMGRKVCKTLLGVFNKIWKQKVC